jgi:type II secretory ATPase GspE/PulE/Tfp pilus assembly ATPase PilB-like protein
MILVTGPTGSGKTTTLYGILQKLNRPEVKIMTIEDPVEYQIKGINQAAVNVRAGLTFPSAIRAFLRQDPDIIMVGEVRDQETAELCTQAALTGHLVLTSLHTRDAVEALTRLADIVLKPFLVAASVVGVVGQRLVRCLCAQCREPYEPSASTFDALGFPREQRPSVLYRSRGCERCRHTGYKGRVGLFDILTLDEGLGHLVAERAPEASVRAQAEERGLLHSFYADARLKVAEGLTSAEEAARMLQGIPGPGAA